MKLSRVRATLAATALAAGCSFGARRAPVWLPDSGPIAIPGTAPYDQWTFVPITGTRCGTGGQTGIAINPHAGNSGLVVYLEGGGACWSYEMCTSSYVPLIYGPYAYHLDGYGASEFDDDYVALYQIFDRADPHNPFADDDYVFVPYCTGDVHSGDNVAVYSPDAGAAALPVAVAHVGFANVGADLAAVLATFPTPGRLVVTGSSAGGFGSLFNYGRIHDAFPGVPAFLIDDSGPPLRTPFGTADWYEAQAAAWGNLANLPAACTACADAADGGGPWELAAFYAQDPAFRGSLLETERDDIISFFYALPPGDPNEVCLADGGGPCSFEAGLADLQQNVLATAGPGQWHVYFEDATFHTYLGDELRKPSPSQTPLETFLAQQLGDAGAWSDVTP